jgi:CDP-6-deoxy-D-xylo-4-hexulose-3-dehydrase
VNRSRSEIVKKFEENKIDIRPLIAGSMGNQPFWQKYYGKKQSFKNADFIDKYGFYVPNHPELIKEEIDLVCDIINKTE